MNLYIENGVFFYPSIMDHNIKIFLPVLVLAFSDITWLTHLHQPEYDPFFVMAGNKISEQNIYFYKLTYL